MGDDANVTDNVSLWNNDGDKEVAIINDSVNERLAVDALTKDQLQALGWTDTFTDSKRFTFSNPLGLSLAQLYFDTLGENSCPYELGVAATITPTTNLLQVFRAPVDNFSGMCFFGNLVPTATTDIDDFNSTSLTSQWLDNDGGSGDILRARETGIEYESPSCLRIRTTSSAAGYNTYRDFGSEDLSTAEVITFWYRSTSTGVKWKLRLEDNPGQTLESGVFSASVANTWEQVSIPISNFIEIGTGTTDLSDIEYVRWYCEDDNNATYYSYFDLLQFKSVPVLVDVTLELYDFGTTANPTNISQGTLLTNDYGVSIATATVSGTTPRKYCFRDFPIGVFDTLKELTVGNYYGMNLKVASDSVEIIGNSVQTYSSGKTYTEVESTGAFTDTTNSMGFQSFTTPDFWMVGVGGFFNAIPLSTEFNAGIKLAGENVVSEQVVCGMYLYQETNFVFPLGRPYYFPKGSRMVVVVDKDGDSSISNMSIFAQGLTMPITRYG